MLRLEKKVKAAKEDKVKLGQRYVTSSCIIILIRYLILHIKSDVLLISTFIYKQRFLCTSTLCERNETAIYNDIVLQLQACKYKVSSIDFYIMLTNGVCVLSKCSSIRYSYRNIS